MENQLPGDHRRRNLPLDARVRQVQKDKARACGEVGVEVGEVHPQYIEWVTDSLEWSSSTWYSSLAQWGVRRQDRRRDDRNGLSLT